MQRLSSEKKRHKSEHTGPTQTLASSMHQGGDTHHPIGAHGLDRHMHQDENGYHHPLDNKFLGGFMKQR
jgi:hypothetical protein